MHRKSALSELRDHGSGSGHVRGESDMSADTHEESQKSVPDTSKKPTGPVGAMSVGLSLLQQFQRLKEEKVSSSGLHEGTGEEEEDGEEEEEEGGKETSMAPYAPVEIDLPVDSLGHVKRGAQESNPYSNAHSSKQRYLIDRDPDIQVMWQSVTEI